MKHAFRMSLLAAAFLFSVPAGAQTAPTVSEDGRTVVGSITADGVTYSAEDLASMARAYQMNPAGLPALPSAVYDAVITLAARLSPLAN